MLALGNKPEPPPTPPQEPQARPLGTDFWQDLWDVAQTVPMQGGIKLSLPQGLQLTQYGKPLDDAALRVGRYIEEGNNHPSWDNSAMSWLNKFSKGPPGFSSEFTPSSWADYQPGSGSLTSMVRNKNGWPEAALDMDTNMPEAGIGHVNMLGMNPELDSLMRGRTFHQLLEGLWQELQSRGVNTVEIGGISPYTRRLLKHLLRTTE